MFVVLEPNDAHDEFEHELRQAFERRPAPPSLKRRLMERRAFEKRRVTRVHPVFGSWQALAASMVLMAVLAGGAAWRNREERRKEDAAREQVLTALRITSRALNQMNSRLASHGHATQD
jgi:hypothetical protein